jgi:heme-binding HmuY-like protein
VSAGGARPPILVLAMGGAFALLIVSLVIGSFTTPEFPPYRPTVPPPHPAPVGDSLVGPATYTLDASDIARWRRFDFGRSAAVDSGGWDIAFRRFHVITALGGGIVDLGPVPFDSVRELPAAPYLPNTNAADTTNPGVGKWYAYSVLSHLLTSKRHVYGVRTAGGKYAKVELLAYYCKEVGTACLTFRYVYQGDGTRRVAPPHAPAQPAAR